ncbi:MAG: hypothetical protein KC615_14775 [Anaerolineae bacterium]|nr:hypothetical protein [Anaerolineae bacterium]
MMPEDEVILNLAHRTRKNLVFIDRHQNDPDVEEFTQLLNSMLGMLISLHEEYFKGNPQVTWEDVSHKPIGNQTIGHVENFSEFIEKLRHAFAHACFDLLGDPAQSRGEQEIVGIRVWNVSSRTPRPKIRVAKRFWEAILTKEELREITEVLLDYLERKHGPCKS